MNLNKLLAELLVFNQKVYTLHWNVEGENGLSSHKQTQEVYEAVGDFIDEIGEKAKMSGEILIGTLKEALEIATIQEVKAKIFNAEEIARILLKDFDLLEKISLGIKADHRIQPLMDEIFMFIDKQRYLFKMF